MSECPEVIEAEEISEPTKVEDVKSEDSAMKDSLGRRKYGYYIVKEIVTELPTKTLLKKYIKEKGIESCQIVRGKIINTQSKTVTHVTID